MLGIDDIVIFGIKAGIKLAQQGRQAYVESTISRELILPLPNFNAAIGLSTALTYFRGRGGVHLEDKPRLKSLFEKAENNNLLEEGEENDLIKTYKELKLIEDVNSGEITGTEIGFSRDTLISLVTIKQWSRNESPFPSAAQRVVGTLIEIGVDYFADAPGTFDESSASGRALKGFLKSIDDLNFADEKVDAIAKKLFISAVETIGENPDLLGADDKTCKLVEVVSKGIVKDVRIRLDDLAGGDLSKQEMIQDWAQLVLRSVLSSAGETVLANPNIYLGIENVGKQALVSSVGTSILDVIIDEDSIDLSELFSRHALDKVVKAALIAVSENPDIIGVDNEGVKKILTQLAKDLGKSSATLGLDILPEVMRLVIEKSAQNLELLWDSKSQDPTKHLLILTSKLILEELAKIPESGNGWKPRLSHSQIINILEVALDEVVQNPQWLIELGESGSPLMGELIKSVISVLQTVPSNRLSSATAVIVIKEAIKNVALRKEFLDKITVDGRQKLAIAAVLDTIIELLLSDNTDSKAKWILARGQVFDLIVSTILLRLAEIGISKEVLNKIKKRLTEAIDAIKSNKEWNVELLIQDNGSTAA